MWTARKFSDGDDVIVFLRRLMAWPLRQHYIACYYNTAVVCGMIIKQHGTLTRIDHSHMLCFADCERRRARNSSLELPVM